MPEILFPPSEKEDIYLLGFDRQLYRLGATPEGRITEEDFNTLFGNYNKATLSSQPKIFIGFVNSGGTAGTPFPSGWSSTRLDPGVYRITHNLSTINYVVLTMVINSTVLEVGNIGERSEANNKNSFDIIVRDRLNALSNRDFMFLALFS